MYTIVHQGQARRKRQQQRNNEHRYAISDDNDNEEQRSILTKGRSGHGCPLYLLFAFLFFISALRPWLVGSPSPFSECMCALFFLPPIPIPPIVVLVLASNSVYDMFVHVLSPVCTPKGRFKGMNRDLSFESWNWEWKRASGWFNNPEMPKCQPIDPTPGPLFFFPPPGPFVLQTGRQNRTLTRHTHNRDTRLPSAVSHHTYRMPIATTQPSLWSSFFFYVLLSPPFFCFLGLPSVSFFLFNRLLLLFLPFIPPLQSTPARHFFCVVLYVAFNDPKVLPLSRSLLPYPHEQHHHATHI